MAKLPGWCIDHKKSVAVTLAADVSEGQVLKLTANDTADVCGAGEVPAGVASRDVDISEDGTRSEIVKGDKAVCIAAAAVTDLAVPLTTAASGQVTPCTSNNDPIVGYPLNTQSTVGGYVLVSLEALGTYYGA